jgi:hypothetical protein
MTPDEHRHHALSLQAPAAAEEGCGAGGARDLAIPRKKGGKVTAPPAETDAESKPEVKSAIVTARKRGRRFADVPDVTPEEHRREGDLADELWREMVRRVTGKDHLMRKIPSTTRVRRPAPVPNARAV